MLVVRRDIVGGVLGGGLVLVVLVELVELVWVLWLGWAAASRSWGMAVHSCVRAARRAPPDYGQT